jgi:hypothetical protein
MTSRVWIAVGACLLFGLILTAPELARQRKGSAQAETQRAAYRALIPLLCAEHSGVHATPTATNTPTPTATNTATPTATNTPTATATSTSTPTPTATSTPTPTATSSPTPEGPPGDDELVVVDWDELVTKADRGFPRDYSPSEEINGDWTQPINFAEGRFYFRVEIFSQPVPQEMLLQLCFWQAVGENDVALENCAKKETVWGTPGNVVIWSSDIEDMSKKDGIPIDWTRPRSRIGIAIKNNQDLPVSDIGDWNWNGEDPDAWYPIDWRFTAVVVAKDAEFSGWGNYIP